jgi:hypothetical protein
MSKARVYVLKSLTPGYPHSKALFPKYTPGSYSPNKMKEINHIKEKETYPHQTHPHPTIYPIKGHSIKGLYTP